MQFKKWFDGSKVVVPVLIESVKTINNNDIDLTVYDSNNWMEQFLVPAIKAEKNGVGIFYFDAKKASRYDAYSKKIGMIPTGFVHNIAQAGINVKPQTETFQFKNGLTVPRSWMRTVSRWWYKKAVRKR